MLLAADPADGWALPVADAVELLHVDELPVHAEPGELRDDVPVRVVLAGTGGTLVVDGPVLSDQLHRSRESRGAGIHRLAMQASLRPGGYPGPATPPGTRSHSRPGDDRREENAAG